MTVSPEPKTEQEFNANIQSALAKIEAASGAALPALSAVPATEAVLYANGILDKQQKKEDARKDLLNQIEEAASVLLKNLKDLSAQPGSNFSVSDRKEDYCYVIEIEPKDPKEKEPLKDDQRDGPFWPATNWGGYQVSFVISGMISTGRLHWSTHQSRYFAPRSLPSRKAYRKTMTVDHQWNFRAISCRSHGIGPLRPEKIKKRTSAISRYLVHELIDCGRYSRPLIP